MVHARDIACLQDPPLVERQQIRWLGLMVVLPWAPILVLAAILFVSRSKVQFFSTSLVCEALEMPKVGNKFDLRVMLRRLTSKNGSGLHQ